MLRTGLLIILMALTGLGCAAQTRLRLYRPFSANKDQDVVSVTQTHKGWCWEQSQVDKRKDAWRCVIKNKVYDPCFVKSYGDKQQAVCPVSPWNGQAILIQLESNLSTVPTESLDMSRHYPWAIELSNGTRCQAIVDSKLRYDGMPVRYRCQDQSVLFGHLQRCKAIWRVMQKQDKEVTTAEIKRVWF